jgi:uncharacterized membrane protein (DUF373 family)
MDVNSILRVFRIMSVVLYIMIIIITITLGGVALYLAIKDLVAMAPFSSVSDVKILGTLSAVFLVVIALEFVDMFIEYIKTNTVVVDLVLAIVLTAISRELLLYIATPNEPLYYGVILVTGILALAVAYWLVNRASKTK